MVKVIESGRVVGAFAPLGRKPTQSVTKHAVKQRAQRRRPKRRAKPPRAVAAEPTLVAKSDVGVAARLSAAPRAYAVGRAP